MNEPALSLDTTRIYRSVLAQYGLLASDVGMFDVLFHEKNGNAEWLLSIARGFFNQVWELISFRVQVTIPRLLDAHEQRANRNLTFDTLVAHVERDGFTALADDLRARLTHLRELAAPIVKQRHKRLAHSDYQVALGEVAIAGVTLGEVHAVVDGMGEFLDRYQAEFGAYGEHREDLAGHGDGDARVLVHKLSEAFGRRLVDD